MTEKAEFMMRVANAQARSDGGREPFSAIQKMDNLTDALVENILSTSDEEIMAEVAEDDLIAVVERLAEAEAIVRGLLDFPTSPSWIMCGRAFLKSITPCNGHERIYEDGSGYICRHCGEDMDNE
jgi:hypothetical protein